MKKEEFQQTVQQKIIRQIAEKQKQDPSVVGMVVFGSCSVGQEKLDSDIDIEIISTKIKKYKLNHRKIKGVRVDLEIIPEKEFKRWIKEYPFLWYDYYKRHRVLLDKKSIITKAIAQLEAYFIKNPLAVEFWNKKLQLMKKQKSEGKQPENCYHIFDEAEIKFSKQNKVTRNFFLK
ncbi:hypothetical protein CMI37_26335 [Candidatus Pacearchaeota archaeon]|nr:hypothetical protein [Candidatus Pacearchaeota archaeon]|tara:strand:+ start:1717 stop:2244 length:528 start_codon:yes stop_codon:yes gene_type:complete